MNGKVGKGAFAVRTIAVLCVIYGLTMFAATVFCAMEYQTEVLETVRKEADEIARDLRECTGVNPKSVESRNGFQVAQAAAVMRHHLYMKKLELKKMGADFDATFYRTIKDQQGNIYSLEEVRPQTPVLLSAPFSKKSPIIVFADTFNAAQMKQLEDVLKRDDLHTYIEDVEGYQEGRFFLPTKITIGWAADGKSEVTIQTDYRDESKKKVKKNFQDVQVIGPGERLVGDGDGQKAGKSKIRQNYESGEETNVRIYGSSVRSGWLNAARYGNIASQSENYVLQYGAEMKPLPYVASHFKKFYCVAALIFFLLGSILMGGHNKVLERRFENEERRRRMMDAMAHEMKTPLSIMKNYGEMLIEEESGEKGRPYARTIVEEADYMNSVVVSMLDLSKMEAGTYPMELSSLSVTRLAEKTAERMDVLKNEKNLRLDLQLEETPRILADEKLVGNILSNFMSNAIFHADEGSRITVSVKPEGKQVRISVHNQGAPISQKDLKKIWNSFYRSDSGRNRRDGGSGLGLAIVRNACLIHGGTYGCMNEGDGVTFWARIPSMEKSIARTAMQTGSILNVTGNGYRLKGLISAAIGMILQGVFGYTLYMGAFLHLFVAEYMDLFPFSIIEICGLLASWLLILAGTVRIHRRGLNMKPVVIASGIGFLLTVVSGEEILRIWHEISAMEPPSTFLLICRVLMFVNVMAVNGLFFWKLGKMARACGDERFVKKLIWKFCVYVICCILYVALIVTDLIWVIISYTLFCPIWFFISVFATYAWLQGYRRLNGREPQQ